MITKINDQKGFTVVDVLITLVIAVIVFSLALSLQFFGVQSYNRGTSQAEVQQNARLIDEVIRKELRNATSIGTGSKTLNFSSNILSFGNVSFELDGIDNISLSTAGEKANDSFKILRYTITGNGYSFVNEVLLNNTSIPEGMNLNFPLNYNTP